MAEARPTGLPTDAELIALLRQRLTTVEDAVAAWVDSAQETGAARLRAYLAMSGDLTQHAGEATALPESVQAFLSVYRETVMVREAAIQRLTDALTTDWRTALLSAPDLTPEQAAEWLGQPPEGGEGMGDG